MSGVFPPGTRPDQWGTIGDLQRRIQGLEALPCCFDSNLGPNTTYSQLVLANPCVAAYWPMDDTGPGALDVFGPYNLTENPTGAATGQPVGAQGAFSFTYGATGPWPTAPESTAIGFDGNDLTLAHGTILYATVASGTLVGGDFSVSGWVYLTDTTLHIFWDLYTGTADYVQLGTFGSSPNIKLTYGSSHGSSITTTSLTTGTWYFVTVTYNNATSQNKLYLNGVLEDTDTFSSGVSAVGGTLRFGAGGLNVNGPSNFLNGRQAQTAWFNCVLTPAEVAELAASTNEPSLLAEAGSVPVADGGGGYSWEFPLEVQY